MRYSVLLMGSVAALSLLTACSTTSAPDTKGPRLVADQAQALDLSVGQVRITPPAAADMPTGFNVSLPQMLQTYAMRRFIGDSTSSQVLLVSFERADVKYARTESSNNVTRWMRLDGHDDYTLSVRMRMTLQNAQGADQVTHEISLQNTLSLPDAISLDERDRRTKEFTEQFLADLDSRATQALTSTFLVTTPR